MKTLKESILADMEDTLLAGDKKAKELNSVGSILEIESIYGDETALMNIFNSKIIKATEGKNLFNKKKTEDVIDRFETFYCGPFGLSKSIKNKLQLFITYIDNMQLTDIKIDFDNKKVKDNFCKELTQDFIANGIMSNAEFHNRAGDAGGGDARGLFQLSLQSKQYMVTFLFKIKK